VAVKSLFTFHFISNLIQLQFKVISTSIQIQFTILDETSFTQKHLSPFLLFFHLLFSFFVSFQGSLVARRASLFVFSLMISMESLAARSLNSFSYPLLSFKLNKTEK